MKRFLCFWIVFFLFASAAFAQFSFYLVDNFESGKFSEGSKWWLFGDIKTAIIENSSPEAKDLIAESCGDYALNIFGETKEWYVGGMGTDLGIDATAFSRFQIDVSGDRDLRGKLIVELFDDDNQNFKIEQDPKRNYEPVYDDRWAAEINIQGEGFTRTSIPFSAFRDVNPGIGDDVWNPDQENGSGGLLKLQIVLIAAEKESKVDLDIDNLLITY